VTSIIAATKTGDDIGFGGEQVGYAPLTLVTPL
jgi:hypothetical protein